MSLNDLAIDVPHAAVGAAAAELRAALGARVVLRDDPGFDAARTPWNIAVSQHPFAVALPESADDVVEVVRARNPSWLAKISAPMPVESMKVTEDRSSCTSRSRWPQSEANACFNLGTVHTSRFADENIRRNAYGPPTVTQSPPG